MELPCLSASRLLPYNGQNGRRRQGLLLLSRDAPEAGQLHPDEPAQSTESIIGMRRRRHRLRLVHSFLEATASTSCGGQRNGAGKIDTRRVRAFTGCLRSRRQRNAASGRYAVASGRENRKTERG